MPSRYDDELWELVPRDPGPPPTALCEFASSLGQAEDVLDLGAGDGRLSCCLRAARLTLADVSGVALERARERLPEARIVELEPDAPLPLADSSFNLALCAETLEHVRDVQLLLSEVRRVLRPGGRLAVTTPAHGRATALVLVARGFESGFDPISPHLRFFTVKSLRRLLEQMGFDVEALKRRRGTLFAVARR